MKNLPVLFTALAEEDLDQIEDYICATDPAAAARVRATIVQQSLELAKMPAKEMALREPANEQEITPLACFPLSQLSDPLQN